MRRLPYVLEYRDRHGKLRRYFRRHGLRVTLPGNPGSPEFMTAYQAALVGLVVPREKVVKSRSASGTVSAAIEAYYADTSFRVDLSPTTQQSRRWILERFRADHGEDPIALMQRIHLVTILSKKKPAAARNWLKAIHGLMQFAVKFELRLDDPTADIKPAKPPKTQGYHTWDEDEIAQYEATHAIGSPARLAMTLILYTALRRSDIIRLGPQHIRGGFVVVRPKKTERTTGITLRIPVHSDLANILAQTPTTHLTFLTTSRGAPFTPSGFSHKVREWCDEAGLPECSAHGLRKAQCRRLAEAGATAKQIGAVSGHTSLKEIEHYTKAADQERLATAAMALLQRQEQEPNSN